MIHLTLAALLSAVIIAPAAAQEAEIVQKTVIKEEKVVEGAATDEARLVNDCSARKFETSAVLDKDGTKRVTKLKLCSNPGADDSAWIKTLEGAKARVAGIAELSPESRVKIEAELDAEIARLHKAMGQ
ncbi:MAG: hypothetical protein ACR2FK_07405 [Sphingomicrobium sp.]